MHLMLMQAHLREGAAMRPTRTNTSSIHRTGPSEPGRQGYAKHTGAYSCANLSHLCPQSCGSGARPCPCPAGLPDWAVHGRPQHSTHTCWTPS